MKVLHQPFVVTPGATLTPGRGLRTTGALVLALLVLALFAHTPFGSAFGLGFLLGVLFTSFCDFSGIEQARTQAMSAVTLGGPIAVAAGRSLAAPWWLTVLGVFFVTLLAGSLPVGRPLMRLVTILLTIVFVVAEGIGGSGGAALPSALGFFFGGVVVLLLTLASSLPARLRSPAALQAEKPAPAQPPRSFAKRLSLRDVHFRLTRQALLRALGVGGAAALAWKLGVSYPQWAPISVIVCVRPDKETAVLVAIQNSIGTVLGALLADLLINTVPNTLVGVLLVLVIVFIAFTVKDLNFALFTFFMTNLTLLLISLSSPGVSHVRLRVFSILVGAGIALAVTFLDHWFAQRQAPLTTPTS